MESTFSSPISSDNAVNRIQTKLDALRADTRKAFIAYVVAGDPDTQTTLALMHEMVASGVDIIELGVPFSDPSAEGPVIQRAHERAVEAKVGLPQVFDIVKQFRDTDQVTPIVLMGYANPIEWMGYAEYSRQAAQAGVDGTLVVDIPPEEAAGINSALQAEGLYNVFLLAPTTTSARIQSICNYASGFLYYVSLKGVTGSAAIAVDEVSAKLEEIRQHTALPICVGFGIKDAATAAAVAKVSDGVVVGSAFVDAVARGAKEDAVSRAGVLARGIREALDDA